MTRARTIATQDRTREIHRLEKFLESTGIKLSDYVADLMGVSSRAMLEALINGERDPQVLVELAKGRMRPRMPELIEALTGRFTDHHAFIATINGVSTLVADVIIAETGDDMATFETPGRLASWAGVSPASNESAGRVKSTHTRHGDSYLKGALGVAVLSIARHPNDSHLGAHYKRIIVRRYKIKAIIANEHTIIAAIWQMLTNGVIYEDLGEEFFTRQNPIKAKNNAIKRLHELGYNVSLTPTTTDTATAA